MFKRKFIPSHSRNVHKLTIYLFTQANKLQRMPSQRSSSMRMIQTRNQLNIIKYTQIKSLSANFKSHFSTINNIINKKRGLKQQIIKIDQGNTNQRQQGQPILDFDKAKLNQSQLQTLEQVKQYIDYSRIYQQNKILLQKVNYGLKKVDGQSSSNREEQEGTVQLKKEVQFFFRPEYLIQALIKPKYYYSDTIRIAFNLSQHLTNKLSQDNSSQQEERVLNSQRYVNKSKSKIVCIQHVHFLLYVYHLYNKQTRGTRHELYAILESYLQGEITTIHKRRNKQNQASEFKIKDNLQVFVYIRKFINQEVRFGNTSKVDRMAQIYCQMLHNTFTTENQELQKSLQLSNNQNLTHQITLKAQLLQSYLLCFPDIWTSTSVSNRKKEQITNNNQNRNQRQRNKDKSSVHNNIQRNPFKSQQSILQIYEKFVQSFQHLFEQSLNCWLSPDNQLPLPQPLPTNFSYKHHLKAQFKSLNLNKCYNHLLLVLHHLHCIMQISKFSQHNQKTYQQNKQHNQKTYQQNQKTKQHNEKTQQQNKQQNEKTQQHNKQNFGEIQTQVNKANRTYFNNKLSILNYLPKNKIQDKDGEIKFMRTLIMLHNLFNYHTMRNIQNKEISRYLQTLFQNNQKQMIETKNKYKRREIKFLLGQLVSRLSSGYWVDSENLTGKYFSPPNYNSNNQIKQV